MIGLLALALLTAEPAAPKAAPPAYVIGVEDVLSVHVFRQPELSRRAPVRPDGRISLPLLGDTPAAGLSPHQLAADIAEALKKHMTEADVTVIVEQANSRKFYVMGEVTRAGSYPLLAPVTVLQALSAAGGFREFADTKRVQVLRGWGPGQKRFLFNYDAVVRGRNTEQNILLEAGDTVVVR